MSRLYSTLTTLCQPFTLRTAALTYLEVDVSSLVKEPFLTYAVMRIVGKRVVHSKNSNKRQQTGCLVSCCFSVASLLLLFICADGHDRRGHARQKSDSMMMRCGRGTYY